MRQDATQCCVGVYVGRFSKIIKNRQGFLQGCGTRRTVVGREYPILAGLEFGGFFGVPHKVSINKSAIYGFQLNQIGACGGSSESYAHPLQSLGEERQKRPEAASEYNMT